MHIKHMHEMIEKLADCAKSEFTKGIECVDTQEMGAVTDMLKDLCEAEYYSHIVKSMEEAKKEEEEEDKYVLKRIKEEYGDDEESARRYYDDYRYMRTGRFAPKGRGSYDPSRGRSRRGYTEMMPMYDMMPEIYRDDSEWNRDMDRPMGRMYYSSGNSSNGNTGNVSGNRSSSGNEGSDGRRNYDGDGRSDGRRNNGNRQESRYDRARRGYEETKMTHGGNNPEDKQHRMRELDSYVKELGEDITDMIADASQEERTLLKQKIQGLAQKIQ